VKVYNGKVAHKAGKKSEDMTISSWGQVLPGFRELVIRSLNLENEESGRAISLRGGKNGSQ